MRTEKKSLWRACVGVVLLFCLIYGYVSYPDYSTTQARQALLAQKEGAAVEIVEEQTVDDHIVCQLRIGGKLGFGVFREFIGKTVFQQYNTTSSDRLADHLEIGGQSWILLICADPRAEQAVIHYYNSETMTYTSGEPIHMAGKQMLLIPHNSELGSHGYTEYFDGNGNLI